MSIRYIVATAAYCVFLYLLSAQSDPPKPDIEIPGLDKVAHFVLYAGLAGLISVGLRRSKAQVPPRVQFFVPIAFSVAYGLSDEFHQSFVPNRHFDVFDLAADVLGALLVQVVLCGFVWRTIPNAQDSGTPPL